MAVGFGHAFDSEMMLAAAATVTADASGGVTAIYETPMNGMTARMVISTLACGTNGGAVRLRILSANNSASTFQTIAASPAVSETAAESASCEGGIELLVRFGTDWDWIKYVIDTFGTVTLRHEGIGLVRDGVKFPKWRGDEGGAYWTDGADVQA